MKEEIPNPGTVEAFGQGCICPVIDNHYGRGLGNDGKTFWYTENCPVHTSSNTEHKEA